MAMVLVVDDDESLLEMMRHMLQRYGFEVCTVRNGREAESLLRDEPALDLLITDIFMPEMDGVETLRLFRELRPELPAIAMSGGTNAISGDILELVGKLGFRHRLEKPFTPDQLYAVVRTALGGPSPCG